MDKIRFIGDVHGKFSRYKDLIRDIPTSRQVGDMGVGFYRYDEDYNIVPYNNPPHDTMIREGDHRYIRGNHDNPEVCKQQKLWIPDGYVEKLGDKTVMYVGGALSIDRAWRKEGLNYWINEELSHKELIKIFADYIYIKPDIMITHDCPEFFVDLWLANFNRKKFDDPSVTRNAFDYFFEAHQPQLWIYGHWHRSFEKKINNTTFVCLGELQYMDLNTETMKYEIDRKKEKEETNNEV